MTILSTSSQDNRCFNADIAAKLEDINAAVIVQQLHYWLNKDVGVVIDGVRWVYNSFDSWVTTQFKWLSVWQFRQSMSLLRQLEIVKVNCLKPDKKPNSGLGNAFNGIEANSSACTTKVLIRRGKLK